jgi:hexulose-6-phosphate isomerase
MNRREFVKSSGVAAAASVLGASVLNGTAAAADTPEDGVPEEPRLKKAVKYDMVRGEATMAEKFQMLKELGFDGVELSSPNDFVLGEVLAARDEAGLPIHGLVNSVHWRDTLSHPDAEIRQRGVEGMITALNDAKAYGATSVLLVPAVVSKDVSYDDAYVRSQAEIRKVLPLAEELGIKIGLENVWNQFLLSPLETARYIDELDSPMVGAYFDVGNVVTYGWPEQWIRILGPRIIKLDIKEFSRKRRDEEGLGKGFGVKIGDGDCDWPAVMTALADIDYHGWATAEVPGGDRERLTDIAARMDRAFAS